MNKLATHPHNCYVQPFCVCAWGKRSIGKPHTAITSPVRAWVLKLLSCFWMTEAKKCLNGSACFWAFREQQNYQCTYYWWNKDDMVSQVRKEFDIIGCLFSFLKKITFLDDKYFMPSATCQENFINCREVKLVCGLTSGSL